jgi:ATP-dependent Lon protease
VRLLERELAALCRKAALKITDSGSKSVNVQSKHLEELLGPKKHKRDTEKLKSAIGLVHGLAWTSVGGELLDVEVNVMEGIGKLELTGNLGDVMKESARAGLSYIRSKAAALGIDTEFYKNRDLHIHFPEGATPKDGPSAGIAVTLALISALTNRPVRGDIAMTGEITLRGRVLPIGGLREKTMGALRAGIHTLIIPRDNEADLAEIDPLVRNALNFITTEHMDKVLTVALE